MNLKRMFTATALGLTLLAFTGCGTPYNEVRPGGNTAIPESAAGVRITQIEKGTPYWKGLGANLEDGTYLEIWPGKVVGTKNDLKCLTTVFRAGMNSGLITRSCDFESANGPAPAAPAPVKP